MREQKRKAQIEKKSKLQYHTHSLLPNPQPDRNQSPPRHLSHPPSLIITIQWTKEEKKLDKNTPINGFHEGGVSYQFSEIASAFDLYE